MYYSSTAVDDIITIVKLRLLQAPIALELSPYIGDLRLGNKTVEL